MNRTGFRLFVRFFHDQVKRRHIQRLKQEHKEMSDKLRDSLSFLKDINQKLLEDDATRALVFQHVFMMRQDIDFIEQEIMEIENPYILSGPLPLFNFNWIGIIMGLNLTRY